jgi:hypothetical protein
LQCCEPAAPETVLPEIVIGAPYTVLRLSAFFNANDRCETAEAIAEAVTRLVELIVPLGPMS